MTCPKCHNELTCFPADQAGNAEKCCPICSHTWRSSRNDSPGNESVEKRMIHQEIRVSERFRSLFVGQPPDPVDSDTNRGGRHR